MLNSGSRNIVVLNSQHPELGFVAAELARRDALQAYVRAQFLWPDEIGKVSKRVPRKFRGPVESALRRRVLPDADHLRGSTFRIGAIPDLLVALGHVGKLASRLPAPVRAAEDWRAASLSRTTAAMLKSGVLVSNFGCALEAFRRAKEIGVKCVLSFPFVEPRWFDQLSTEERARVPEFAHLMEVQSPKRRSRFLAELELSDRVIVGSRFAESTFEGVLLPQHLRVSPYGGWVLPEYERSETPRPFTIVFAGQIGQRKGLSYLLAAFKSLHSSGVRLILAGKPCGDLQLIRRHLEGVEVLGYLTKSALAEVFSRADVFALPSLSEGLGIAALDAMGSGLPVVTTPSGPDEVVRHGIEGLVVPIRDSDALASAFTKLMEEKDLRTAMGVAARRRATEFSWQRYAARTADLLSEMVTHD